MKKLEQALTEQQGFLSEKNVILQRHHEELGRLQGQLQASGAELSALHRKTQDQVDMLHDKQQVRRPANLEVADCSFAIGYCIDSAAEPCA